MLLPFVGSFAWLVAGKLVEYSLELKQTITREFVLSFIEISMRVSVDKIWLGH